MEKRERKENYTKDEQKGFNNTYKRKIIELVEEIDSQKILIRVYSFMKGLLDGR